MISSRVSALALFATLSAFATVPSGVSTGTTTSRSLLVGITTGAGEDLVSEVATIDPIDGTTTKVGSLVLPKGHGRTQSQDLVWSADGKQLLVAQLRFGEKGNEATSWIDWVSPSKLEVVRSGTKVDGVIDSLCWDGQGRLLATHARTRPMKLVTIDTETGALTELATLDEKLWIRSLAWRTSGSELWALHMRASEKDSDLLMRLSPTTGAALYTVKLELGEIATSLVIDVDGNFLVAGDKDGLFRVDVATGKSRRLPKATGVRFTGLVTGR